MHNALKRGFSLVEIAIVLVIISVLVVAVMGAGNLSEAMRRSALVADLNMYDEAYVQFLDKYKYPPGDYPYCTNSWGVSCTGGGGMGDNGNGTGNNVINGVESLYAWQHLSLAGYIQGQYSGTNSNLPSELLMPDVDVPSGPHHESVFYISEYQHISPVTHTTYGNVNMLSYGRVNDKAGRGGMLTPAEAKQVDDKMDDGKPLTGMLWSQTGSPAIGECIEYTDDGDYTNDVYADSADKNKNCFLRKLFAPPFVKPIP